MRTTSAERMRALRARRRRGKLRLEVDLHADDLREIALRGYEGAASTDGRSRPRPSLCSSPIPWSEANSIAIGILLGP
jgi:hypothetical protein